MIPRWLPVSAIAAVGIAVAAVAGCSWLEGRPPGSRDVAAGVILALVLVWNVEVADDDDVDSGEGPP